MAKKPSKKPKSEEIELVPGAWPRFERFVRDIARAGPQHRKGTGRTVPPKLRKTLSPKDRDE